MFFSSNLQSLDLISDKKLSPLDPLGGAEEITKAIHPLEYDDSK